jgi:cytoskeletal protein CcmA (bactofilin family)
MSNQEAEKDMENNQAPRTMIGQDVEITGSVKCGGAIQVDGKLNGDLTCSGNVVIGAGAAIKGNLSVNSVTVLGSITGNVVAKDKIELKASANVNGDIRAKRMSVEDGVTFVGKSEVNPSGSQARPDQRAIEPENAPVEAPEDVRPRSGGLFGKK